MTLIMISLSLSILIFFISSLSPKTNKNKEKMNSFECGFNPISTPRNPFSIQFFKVLLIFLIFDMEIIVILPAPLFHHYNLMKIMMFLFIMIVILSGLLYEIKEGSLQWVK
nr:NADH dehydrogenase subunit 3 [Amblyseius swirskii]